MKKRSRKQRLAQKKQREPVPPDVRTLFAEAILRHQAGNLPNAERLYREILATDSRHADTLCVLGILAHQTGRQDMAAEMIGKAIAVNDQVAAFHSNLGNVLQAQGKLVASLASYRQALIRKPDMTEAHYNLGVVLQALGKPEAAMVVLRRALACKPDYAEAHFNIGNAFLARGRLAEASLSYRRNLSLNPDQAAAYGNFGNILQEQNKLEDAVQSYRRSLACKPNVAGVHANLGNLLQEQGKLDEALASYETALARQPDFAWAEMNLAFMSLYRTGVGLAEILERSRHWNEIHASGLTYPAHERSSPAGARPKIGFVSADFRSHPVGFLVVPAFEGLARAGFHLTCYSNSGKTDELTARFAKAATVWRAVAGMPDEALAALIRSDGIDILIDLSGYSAGNRLLVFARKPAPIQVAWVGCPATTGLSAMDYMLADRFQVPSDAEPFYTEKLVRLPHSYIAFEPPVGAPPVSDLPALSQDGITFGSFNVLKKITPAVVALWSRILTRLPSSRLILKAKALDCPVTRQHYVGRFTGQGIDPERLRFIGKTSLARHLAFMQQADIALDPFPYSGGQTTLDSLWMGLPVITLPHETFPSRHSLGYLSTIGLTELVASDPDHYVALAVSLANDPARLAGLRSGLRARMLTSPLCDTERFTRSLSDALTMMWCRWCDGKPAESFDVRGDE